MLFLLLQLFYYHYDYYYDRPFRVIPTVNTSVEKVEKQIQLLKQHSFVYNNSNNNNNNENNKNVESEFG